MNARDLDNRILIAVQAPHPVQFGAVFLQNPKKIFFSRVLESEPPSAQAIRDAEFYRFIAWAEPLESSGFAAWGTEMVSVLQVYLQHPFPGGWFDLCSFVDGMDVISGKGVFDVPQVLETLLGAQTAQAHALITLIRARTITVPPLKIPTLARLH